MTTRSVIVIGGGNAGLSVAGRLHRYGIEDVVVVEPRPSVRSGRRCRAVSAGSATR